MHTNYALFHRLLPVKGIPRGDSNSIRYPRRIHPLANPPWAPARCADRQIVAILIRAHRRVKSLITGAEEEAAPTVTAPPLSRRPSSILAPSPSFTTLISFDLRTLIVASLSPPSLYLSLSPRGVNPPRSSRAVLATGSFSWCASRAWKTGEKLKIVCHVCEGRSNDPLLVCARVFELRHSFVSTCRFARFLPPPAVRKRPRTECPMMCVSGEENARSLRH